MSWCLLNMTDYHLVTFKMRVLVILLDLVTISETQEPAIINDIARDSKFHKARVLIGHQNAVLIGRFHSNQNLSKK